MQVTTARQNGGAAEARYWSVPLTTVDSSIVAVQRPRQIRRWAGTSWLRASQIHRGTSSAPGVDLVRNKVIGGGGLSRSPHPTGSGLQSASAGRTLGGVRQNHGVLVENLQAGSLADTLKDVPAGSARRQVRPVFGYRLIPTSLTAVGAFTLLAEGGRLLRNKGWFSRFCTLTRASFPWALSVRRRQVAGLLDARRFMRLAPGDYVQGFFLDARARGR